MEPLHKKPFSNPKGLNVAENTENEVYENSECTDPLPNNQATTSNFYRNKPVNIQQPSCSTNSDHNADESVYEVCIPITSPPTETVKIESKPVEGHGQGKSKCIAIIAIIIAIISCGFAVMVLVKTSLENVQPQLQETTSCLDLRDRGENRSGIFTIHPDRSTTSFQTFCDMTSDGGGWTLVASVHENNIDGKCTVGDKWSSEQGIEPSTLELPGNWASLDLFGHIEAVTSADYKNPAYYNLEATDIMLWHVPNQVEIKDLEERAFLKYFTTTGFLGGMTLRSFFTDTAPLRRWPDISLNNAVWLGRLQEQIPDFYKYLYDGQSPTYINDGGADMYDEGNKVSFQLNGESRTQVTYGEMYRSNLPGFWATSAAVHPFIFLAWIDSNHADSLSIQVNSITGTDGAGKFEIYVGQFQQNGSTVGYRAFHVYDAGDPSICEVYFHISNVEKWSSNVPTVDYPNWSSGTNSILNEMRLQGSRNILAGYTLLSRTNGNVIDESQVVSVLHEMLRFSESLSISPISEIPKQAQPIQFAKGGLSDIMSRVPLSQANDVAAGSIEFKAINEFGCPHALCPGVRMKTNTGDPELHCIGGINCNGNGRNPTCGDFSDWNKGGDTRIDHPTETGRSLQDIQSTILIFTRNNATFSPSGNSTEN